jgi:membrane protein YqaA with SNARE-associated domain
MDLADLAIMFASSFLAATILPVVSEAVLAGFAGLGGGDLVALVLVATVGNVLGAVVNWWIGGWLTHWQDKKWFPIKAKNLDHASRVFNRWGQPSLLLAWTPFLGDPLTFVAGILRVPIVPFLVYVTIGKAARYILVAAAAAEWL